MRLRHSRCPSFCFFPLLLLPFLAFASSLSRNFLQRGSSLSVEADSDFLTSPDKTFTCGFYLLGQNAYWFAIWFTDSKDRTVVWVANRDQPVNGRRSRLSLLAEGTMVLTDVDGSTIWVADVNTSSSAGVDRAELLDSGNLVLKDRNGEVLWQSFDFPTDTLLPNQPFTKSKKLISRWGSGSFNPGYFVLLFDNDNVLNLMYDGPEISSVYWPDPDNDVFGNSRTKYNSSRIAVFDDMGTFSSSDQLSFNASDMGLGVKRRLTLDTDGNLRLYSLNSTSRDWVVSWEALPELCKVHGLCGRNGICIYTPEPKCSCPPGYEVADSANWNKGCKPTFSFNCSQSQQEKFVMVSQVDFYGFDLSYSKPVSINECRNLCSSDCRCQAFSYRLNGEAVCFTKSALFNGYRSPKFPGSIYLRLPVSVETSDAKSLSGIEPFCRMGNSTIVSTSSAMYNIKKSMKWAYLYWFVAAMGALEVLVIASGWWLLYRTRGVTDAADGDYRRIPTPFRVFSYKELKKATNNFNVELGRGAFGAVYKGVLADETVIAVKSLRDVYGREDVLLAEVDTIGKIYHMNLVRMLGFCSKGKHRLLVFEYIEKGSLDMHLFPPCTLGWKERFKVALGTARGLAYLHHECLEWVIHCDVKPGNILLDQDFEPKISDFGLATMLQRGGTNSNIPQIRGTKGYMAPEWALNLPITAKVDIYSYGVVMLELVRGIRLADPTEGDNIKPELDLTSFIRVVRGKVQCKGDSGIDELVDPRLEGNFDRKQARAMLEIGAACVEEDANKRPGMDFIVQLLSEQEEASAVASDTH